MLTATEESAILYNMPNTIKHNKYKQPQKNTYTYTMLTETEESAISYITAVRRHCTDWYEI